ncbi:hypothetical protein [Acidovorax sp. A1169]|uniref:hypothetical protein n=1 Tax=Acidovorax sp. A1169 TaxID=3059524 RepID=UPI002737A6AC|nr:hypothetical protein [Acidovorax sp. A1169]MDP4075226.1 hypothetical protein [Acidovorax sp. A1169]
MAIPPPKELLELRESVELMDAFSQDGFTEIATLARLALRSLEAPAGYLHLDDIGHALQAIHAAAVQARESIHDEAGRVDCGHVDEAAQRRLCAWQTVYEKGAIHACKSH